METILEVKNITKEFPGIKVFDQFSISFHAGEVHCICGENGAGKSTLIKILSGAYKPDKGEILFKNKKVKFSTLDAIEAGIQTIYQELYTYPHLTVLENLFIGNEFQKHKVFFDRETMEKKAHEIFELLHITSPLNKIVGTLGVGEQKMIEIARGLIRKATVMIMDEPTASLSKSEIEHLFEVIEKLKKAGICIIFISHHLDEIMRIADRVTVIRDGEKINTYDIEGLSVDALVRDMIGRDVSLFYQREETEKGAVMFECKNISGNGVEDISFRVRKGEVLGLTGMVGAGRTELLEVLFGFKKKTAGEILINGKKTEISSPRSALENKMCFITESRQETGLFLELSIQTNIVTAMYVSNNTHFARPSGEKAIAEKYADMFQVSRVGMQQKVLDLSGGNQQKVVLAKWFATDGEIYFFDEPTRGIDIGTKEEIYKIIVELVKQGKCVVMASSEMPEIIAMCDRVLVMRSGKAVCELDGDDINEEQILLNSVGG